MTELQKAYKMVLTDIMNSGCGLMLGKYDTKNGNKHFMYGVETAMEFIAFKASEEDGNNFSELFTKNMIKSEEKR
jgi:hypothetical protein